MAVTSPSVCALSPLINGSAYTIRVLLATSHQTTTAKTNISTSVTGHPHSDIPDHISTYSITYEVPQLLTLLYCVLELTLTPSLRDCKIKEDIKFCRRQCMVRTAGSFSPVQLNQRVYVLVDCGVSQGHTHRGVAPNTQHPHGRTLYCLHMRTVPQHNGTKLL